MPTLAELAFEHLAAGRADAAQLFGRAIAENPTDASLILGEAEALLIAGDADPTRRLRQLVALNPEWAQGHSVLGSMLWELGDEAGFDRQFRQSLAAHRQNPGLWNAYFQLLSGIGRHEAAADAAVEAQQCFSDPMLKLIEANNRGMAGDDERVEALLREVPASAERDEVEVRHRIRLRELDAAAAIVDRTIAAANAGLASWAIAEVLWRYTSDPRWPWLAGASQFIAEGHIGYEPDRLAELATMLQALHLQRRHPVGQSVRGGTQTRGPLLSRHDEPIRKLRQALENAVEACRAQLPPVDPRHPLLRHRDRKLRVQGGWSVRLSSAGFHVPHLHPAGVLSSAFYVRVPPLDSEGREGWLELGRPPPDLRLDLEPLALVEPKPSHLVLFPSYLYHGTRPFSGGERMSVAFDVV